MSFRHLKISKEIQRELASQLLIAPAFITVLYVKTSLNLRHSSIFFSIFGPDNLRQRTLHWISSHSNSFQFHIKKHLNIKYPPTLSWYFINDSTYGGKQICKIC